MPGRIKREYGPPENPSRWQFDEEHLHYLLITTERYGVDEDSQLFTLMNAWRILQDQITEWERKTLTELGSAVDDLVHYGGDIIANWNNLDPAAQQSTCDRFHSLYVAYLELLIGVLSKDKLDVIPDKALDSLCIAMPKTSRNQIGDYLNHLWEHDRSRMYPEMKEGEEWEEEDVGWVYQWLMFQNGGKHLIYVKWKNGANEADPAHEEMKRIWNDIEAFATRSRGSG
ncbi:MAG: hypothetical protein Q9218_003638 [Villophora microphyllina]